MKAFFCFAITAFLLAGCAAPKTLQATGGSRSDGIVELSFEFNLFEKPIPDWDAAVTTARGRCSAWGYSNAERFGGGTTQCLSRDENGNCLRTLVTVKYQCTNTIPPQQQAQAAAEFRENKTKFDAAMVDIKKESDSLCSQQDFKSLFVKSPCLRTDITFLQIADTSKIRPSDKDAFVRLQVAMNKNREDTYKAMTTYGARPKDMENNDAYKRMVISENEQNAADLIQGKITWGEYNANRKKIAEEYEAEYRRIFPPKQ